MNIRKIIREEIEDDFGWVKDIPPFKGGESIPENEICFDEGDVCKVNINKDNITFRVTLDEDFYHEFTSYDDEWIVSDLFQTSMYGGGYDGNEDYYEFDGDEFSYTGHHLDDELRKRIIDFWLEVNDGLDDREKEKLLEKLETAWDQDMYRFEENLKNPTLIIKFSHVVDDVLNALGYAVQKARWVSTSNQFYSEIEKLRDAGIGMEFDRNWGLNNLIVTIPMEIVNEIHREEHFLILENLLKRVLKPITNGYWYDWFHDEGNTEEATEPIQDAWKNFLDFGEEFIVSEEYEEEKKRVDMFYDAFDSRGWRLTDGSYNYSTKGFEKLDEERKKNGIPSKWNFLVYNTHNFLIKPNDEELVGKFFNNLKSRWKDMVEFKVPRKENETPQEYLNRFFEKLDEEMKKYISLHKL